MNEWWIVWFGLYLLWSWHRYGVYQERFGTSLFDLLAVPGWVIGVVVFYVAHKLLKLSGLKKKKG